MAGKLTVEQVLAALGAPPPSYPSAAWAQHIATGPVSTNIDNRSYSPSTPAELQAATQDFNQRHSQVATPWQPQSWGDISFMRGLNQDVATRHAADQQWLRNLVNQSQQPSLGSATGISHFMTKPTEGAMPSSNFQPMGGVPDFYSGLLNSAQQTLVRMPDGTLAIAPQMGGPTSVQQMYGGMLPPQQAPQVASQPGPSDPFGIGPDWGTLDGFVNDPIYYGQAPDTSQQTAAEQLRLRQLQQQQQSAALTAIGTQFGVPHAAGTIDPNKSTEQLGYTQLPPALYGGSGAPPVPRPRPTPPGVNVPLPRPRPGTPMQTGGIQITVPYSAPPPPMPIPRPPTSAPNQYRVQQGDTLWGLQQKYGIPVDTIAAQSGIKDKNKIYVGQLLNLLAAASPSAPRLGGGMNGGPPTPYPTPPWLRPQVGGPTGGAFTGGWGSDGIGRFLAGNPGTTNWNVANQGMQGITGPLNATSYAPAGNSFGPGQSGGGTIYSDPQKYGATSADRQASAAARAALLAQFGG